MSDFPPGYFTALVHAHRWPPRWQPQLKSQNDLWRSAVSTQNRQRRIDAGDSGCILQNLSRKADETRGRGAVQMMRRAG